MAFAAPSSQPSCAAGHEGGTREQQEALPAEAALQPQAPPAAARSGSALPMAAAEKHAETAPETIAAPPLQDVAAVEPLGERLSTAQGTTLQESLQRLQQACGQVKQRPAACASMVMSRPAASVPLVRGRGRGRGHVKSRPAASVPLVRGRGRGRGHVKSRPAASVSRVGRGRGCGGAHAHKRPAARSTTGASAKRRPAAAAVWPRGVVPPTMAARLAARPKGCPKCREKPGCCPSCYM